MPARRLPGPAPTRPRRRALSSALAASVTAATLALVFAAALAFAGATRSVRHTTAKDFEEGEATASMILPTGDVVPGLKTERLKADAAFFWCSTLSADGGTAYFGSGDEGRIFAVSTAAAKVVTARKVAQVDAPWITSLAARADGWLLAGATPGGRVLAVNPKDGTVRPFAKLDAEHVWALVHDVATGTTYAATGSPGKVFAIDGKGGARVLWDSGDKHVVSLLAAGSGTLLAGTADEAVVYRVHADGRAEAVHDFEADEVRAIARAGGATYFAVNDFEKSGEGSSSSPASSSSTSPATGPVAAKGTRITLGGTPVSAGSLPRPGQVKGKGGVYRLDDDGQIEQIIALADGYFTALLPDRSGGVYAATGAQGKVYRLLPDRSVALGADLPERQVLALVGTGDGFLAGTGDIGGIFRARMAAPGDATYLSRVIDAEVPAGWGRLRFSASDGVSFETRAGNTAKPDKSWTDWKKLAGVARAGNDGEGQVPSPATRYLQYRATLHEKSSVLRETTVFFLSQNQRARVIELTLGDAAPSVTPAAGASTASTGTGGGSTPRTHASTLKLRWKVENPDSDDLVFRLWYRPENETVWRTLGGPDPLTKAEYDWNTESVPDDRYVVRVWASDEKVTPHDRALDFTFESPPLLVDNTKPDVIDLAAKLPLVTGRVRDGASVITQIEYSIDGYDWHPAAPADGILDQRTESFALRLPPKLLPGPHVVTVRGFDAADNQGSARILVRIP